MPEQTNQKNTLVIGASDNVERYSNMAVKLLHNHGYHVFAVGNKETVIDGILVQKGMPTLKDVHTVTLYLSPKNQISFYNYILALNPKRIIFNPGTENEELMTLANEKGIETLEACTLVMLQTKQY